MTLLVDLPPLPEVAASSVRLLERVALALSSTLELEEVLGLLAAAGLDATGAGGTAVLLLEGRELVPATVVRLVADDTLDERFHGMAPVPLDDLRWALLRAGRAIVFEDARSSDLIPPDLVDRFTLRGFALVPLMAAGEPYGVMCVDWDEVRAFSPNDVALLEAFGAYAGLAVRNARSYETTRRQACLQEALAHSAATLASPLEPHVVAGRLVQAYTDLLGARMCAVVLFAPDRDEITSVASEGVPGLPAGTRISDLPRKLVARLWRSWEVAKDPVEVGDDPWLADEIGGRDAGASWYLFLPLVVDGHTRGVVALGFAAQTSLDAQERSAAEALADIAAAALERHELLHRLDTQVARLHALYEASAALNSSTSSRAVLELVCAAFEKLLGTSHCSVNLVGAPNPDLLRTLAHRGVPWFAGRPASIGAVAPAEVARARALWSQRAEPVVYPVVDDGLAVEPLVVPTTVRSAVLFPLLHTEGVLGVVVAGFPMPGAVGDDDLETGLALAGLAATAIDRAGLNESLHFRLRQVEALYRLSDVVAGTADLDAALRELSRVFEADLGVVFSSIGIAHRDARAAVGARPPDAEEMEAIRSWRAMLGRRTKSLRPRAATSGLLVPVVHRARVFGALRVSSPIGPLEPPIEELLVAIGGGCAEIIYKAGLHRDVADRERRLTISAERERIARDLHDSVGQVLTGMGMLLNGYLAEAPDDAWRSRVEELVALAGRGAREVRDSIHSLMFIETRRVGLAASLRELTQKFEAMTGIAVTLSVIGRPPAMVAAKEDALFRVAHEALMNVERHAQAAAARVQLRYGADGVVLTVSDDGVGLQPPAADGHHHLGLTTIERRLDEVGGELQVSKGEAGGTVVSARVAVKPKDRHA